MKSYSSSPSPAETKEREERKQMIQEAKLEHDTLGEDESENFKFW